MFCARPWRLYAVSGFILKFNKNGGTWKDSDINKSLEGSKTVSLSTESCGICANEERETLLQLITDNLSSAEDRTSLQLESPLFELWRNAKGINRKGSSALCCPWMSSLTRYCVQAETGASAKSDGDSKSERSTSVSYLSCAKVSRKYVVHLIFTVMMLTLLMCQVF